MHLFLLIQKIDWQILYYIQQHFHAPLLDKIMIFLTTIGYAGAVWLVIAILLITIKSHRRTGLYLLLSIVAAGIMGEFFLKNIIARPRPCHLQPIDHLLVSLPSSYSLPSGHTFISFSAAVFLSFNYKKFSPLILISATLISFTRLYLYLHFPSDILLGMILGILLGYSIYSIQNRKRSSL